MISMTTYKIKKKQLVRETKHFTLLQSHYFHKQNTLTHSESPKSVLRGWYHTQSPGFWCNIVFKKTLKIHPLNT